MTDNCDGIEWLPGDLWNNLRLDSPALKQSFYGAPCLPDFFAFDMLHQK